MAAQEIQRVIDAQQDLDALTYGLRSLDQYRPITAASCAGAHYGQAERAAIIATRLLERIEGAEVERDLSSAAWWIRMAKKKAQENLREAKAARKALGGLRQQRLALAA